jgi:hypothetical protein
MMTDSSHVAAALGLTLALLSLQGRHASQTLEIRIIKIGRYLRWVARYKRARTSYHRALVRGLDEPLLPLHSVVNGQKIDVFLRTVRDIGYFNSTGVTATMLAALRYG